MHDYLVFLTVNYVVKSIHFHNKFHWNLFSCLNSSLYKTGWSHVIMTQNLDMKILPGE